MVRLITTKDANPNYLAKICRITKIEPIPDSTHLSKTIINGYTMVISNDFKEGDIVIYFPVETVICNQFLKNNNLYEIGEYLQNANSAEVGELLLAAEDELKKGNKEKANELKAQAKSKVGFFNKAGRVRMIKLRGVYSEGFICKIDNLIAFDNTLADTNWSELVGTSFNQVNDTLFCWKYIPLKDKIISENEPKKNTQHFWKKRMKKLKKFDRIIPGSFKFHYDTVKLNDTIYALCPNDVVTISVKVHCKNGTWKLSCRILFHSSNWGLAPQYLGLRIAASACTASRRWRLWGAAWQRDTAEKDKGNKQFTKFSNQIKV